MLKHGKTYEEVYNSFRWKVPTYYNIAVDCCDKWAGQRYRLALVYENEKGAVEKFTFWDLKELSNRLANALRNFGIQPGDRVGILLPQSLETALTHLAIYKLGAIAIPIFTLFGPEALEYRLGNSGAKAVVTDPANMDKVLEIRNRLPNFQHLFVTGGPGPEGTTDFWKALEKGASCFKPASSRRRMIFTGLRPIGPGSAGLSTSCSPAGITERRSWPIVPRSSIPNTRSI